MNSIVDLAGIAGVIAVSMGLAVGLEWLSLRALMHLMPGKSAQVPVAEDVVRRTIRQKAA